MISNSADPRWSQIIPRYTWVYIYIYIPAGILSQNPICWGALASASGFSVRSPSLRSTNHVPGAAKKAPSKAQKHELSQINEYNLDFRCMCRYMHTFNRSRLTFWTLPARDLCFFLITFLTCYRNIKVQPHGTRQSVDRRYQAGKRTLQVG